MNWNYGVDYARGPPGSHQPPGDDHPAAAARRHAADLAGVADRRNLPLHPQSPQDARMASDIYTLNDIKALQDWVLEREFRSVPRIVDVTSFGGTVRALRDPARPGPAAPLRRHAAPSCRPRSPTATPTSAATYVSPGPGRHDRPQRRPVRRRDGPGEQGARAMRTAEA